MHLYMPILADKLESRIVFTIFHSTIGDLLIFSLQLYTYLGRVAQLA